MKAVPMHMMWVCVGCLPGALTHYQAELVPLADCSVDQGQTSCLAPGDGGMAYRGSMSVDERGESSRVFFRQETLVGTASEDHVHAESVRDLLREQSGCKTRQRLVLDAVHDDPGLGLRQELTGTVEESTTTEGDPQQCGRNVPFGAVKRYRLTAVQVTEP